jgi:hypothetical protein
LTEILSHRASQEKGKTLKTTEVVCPPTTGEKLLAQISNGPLLKESFSPCGPGVLKGWL